MPATSTTKKPKKTIGGFQLLSRIGVGGMGTVFRARQVSLDRIVALKVLAPHIANRAPSYVKRFIQEARVSAVLNHPNIVQAIEVGHDKKNALYYFAMEYVEGANVKEILQLEGVIEEKRSLEIARAVASAIQRAHKESIIHRDIKPANILLSANGEPKLADLGLAKLVAGDRVDPDLTEGDADEILEDVDSTSSTQTAFGKAVGTPHYMAPEQVRGRGEPIDGRTDLYGLGATLYHMVTGSFPFSGKNSREIMRARLRELPPDARQRNPKVSVATAALITHLMQKDPAKRIPDAGELIERIDVLMKGGARVVTPGRAVRKIGPRPARRFRTNTVREGQADREGKPRRLLVPALAVFLISALIAGSAGRLLKDNDDAGGSSERREARATRTTETGRGRSSEAELSTKRDAPRTEPESIRESAKPSNVTPEALPIPSPPELETAKPEHNDTPPDGSPMPPAKKPDSLPSTPEPIPKAKSISKPKPVRPGFEKLAPMKRLRQMIASMLSSGQEAQAVRAVEAAMKHADFAELGDELEREKTMLGWLGELNTQIESGAKRLLDGRSFTIERREGRSVRVGKTEARQLTGVRDGALYIRFSSADGKISASETWPLRDLNRASRVALSALTIEGDPIRSRKTELMWAYEALTRIDPAAKGFTEELENVEGILAKSSTVPKQVESIRPWLQRARTLAGRTVPPESRTPPSDPKKPEKLKRPTPHKLEYLVLNLGGDCRMRLSLIPAGTFEMGTPDAPLTPKSEASETEYRKRESPRHTVKISKPFYMGVCEVTQTQYKRIVGINPSKIRHEYFPVTHVSWQDAQSFCAGASKRSGYRVTLPTEAQWEYAARAGAPTFFVPWAEVKDKSFKSDWYNVAHARLGQMGWYGRNAYGAIQPVSRKRPNRWGLYDMCGNALEWCRDWYGAYSSKRVSDPTGPARGKQKVLRGGAAHSVMLQCRAASRFRQSPRQRDPYIGFRIIVPASASGRPVKSK